MQSPSDPLYCNVSPLSHDIGYVLMTSLSSIFTVPAVVSLFSLVVSSFAAWINFRRGRVKMTQPRRISLFPRAIYMEALLTSSGSRGKILEELVLVFEDSEGLFQLREWVHQKVGDKGWSERASIFVPFNGYPAAHQWFFSQSQECHKYSPGYHTIHIIDVDQIGSLTSRKGIIFSVRFLLEESIISQAFLIKDGEYDLDRYDHIELSWNSFTKQYEVVPIQKPGPKEDDE